MHRDQVMFADLAQKLLNLRSPQQMRVTFSVDKPVGDMTTAAFKHGDKRLPCVYGDSYIHAYFCENTGSCLKPFLQMVANKGLIIRQYGVQYGLKKAVPMLVPDAENAVLPVLKQFGYVKRPGDDVLYSRTVGKKNDEVSFICFKGETYLQLHGQSSPEAQALEWKQLLECFPAPSSGEETPRRLGAKSLCSLNPGQGDDSPAASTRSKRPKMNEVD